MEESASVLAAVVRKHPRYKPRTTGHKGRGTWSSDLERLLAKVDRTEGCWFWLGPLDYGYGRFFYLGRMHPAHRVSFMLHVGSIPKGRQLDHLCKNRDCVRPEHLEIVTRKTNQERGYWATKTHCPSGHPYKGENLYVSPGGGRQCRTCVRVAGRKWYQKKT